MKSLLLLFLTMLSINSYSQTKKEQQELAKAYLDYKLYGPLPALNGSWKLQSLTIGAKTYYSDKITTYVEEAYQENARLYQQKNQPLSAADSIKVYKKLESTFNSVLKVSYYFNADAYTKYNNENKMEGSISFNESNDQITLTNFDNYEKALYKIVTLTDKKLVLIAFNDNGKNIGTVTFTK